MLSLVVRNDQGYPVSLTTSIWHPTTATRNPATLQRLQPRNDCNPATLQPCNDCNPNPATPQLLTDRKLLTLAAAGDQSAFTALYQRYGARLYAYFLRRCGADGERAEDLRQQVFLQLLESKAFQEAGDGPEDLSSLLFTIAANLMKNAYRSDERRGRRLDAYRDIQRANSSPGEPRIDKHRLRKAIEMLPDHQRSCVDMRFRRGFSVEEIAEALDCAPGTVKSRLHYGLKKLGELLRKTTIE
ncbi:MAG: RNA polymerase sigma-70 factor (ECF subfamily) [Neolewinella sp.]|jgi:RNA polymerase sigma-70 factor (ECF subfamily)